MGVLNDLAKATAERIDYQKLEELVGPRVDSYVRDYLSDLTVDRMRAAVEEYVNSDKFLSWYQQEVRSSLEQLIATHPPVLILEKKGLEEYEKTREVTGPIGTVNCIRRGIGKEVPFNKALNEIKRQARLIGGNIVVLTDEISNDSLLWWTTTLIGHVYLAGGYLEENRLLDK